MRQNATFFFGKRAAESPQSSTNKTTPSTPATPSSRSVFLPDWWLVDAKDNCDRSKLAVGGKNYNRLNMIREFTSAIISKRVDAFTLETIDGFTIVIDGTVNEKRTKLNGFPAEVCSHFLMGFPVNWELYTVDYISKEPMCDFANSSGPNIPRHPPPVPQDGSPSNKIDAFIKLAEYDIYQLSRKCEIENCDTCIGNTNTVEMELNDGSVNPTGELSVSRRSTRLMKVEKIETPTCNETHLQTPLDSPASYDNSSFLKPTRKASGLSNHPSQKKRGRPQKLKKFKGELDSPNQGSFTREFDASSSLFSSPESLNLKRSRSGRLLVPVLDVQQKLIYDGDGTIIGIMKSHCDEDSSCVGIKTKPPRKKVRKH